MTRREFPTSVRKAALQRSGGFCEAHLLPECIEGVPDKCGNVAKELDHIDCDMFGGEPVLENAAYLCRGCHKIKTKADQAARKSRNHHSVRKDRPKTGWFNGPKRKIQSRGFSKDMTRNFKGEVRPR